MTLRELKTTSGEGFVKYLPVKHVSIKDMLRTLKECKNNNQKALLRPIFIGLLRHALCNLRPGFMANVRSHKAT